MVRIIEPEELMIINNQLQYLSISVHERQSLPGEAGEGGQREEGVSQDHVQSSLQSGGSERSEQNHCQDSQHHDSSQTVL